MNFLTAFLLILFGRPERATREDLETIRRIDEEPVYPPPLVIRSLVGPVRECDLVAIARNEAKTGRI